MVLGSFMTFPALHEQSLVCLLQVCQQIPVATPVSEVLQAEVDLGSELHCVSVEER